MLFAAEKLAQKIIYSLQSWTPRLDEPAEYQEYTRQLSDPVPSLRGN